MDKEVNTFEGSSFLPKEAKPDPRLIWQSVKRMNPFSGTQGAKKNLNGTFVRTPGDSAINPEKLKIFTQKEVIDEAADISKRQGTGGLVTDGVLGLTKMIIPKVKQPIERGVEKFKDTGEKWDTYLGGKLAGKDPSTLRGKSFSTKVSRKVGEHKNPDGTISPVKKEDRRPSLLGPITNTSKAVTPLLGVAYVGEKMYGEPDKSVTQTPYEPEEHNAYDEREVMYLEKQAYMSKVAQLEEELENVRQTLESEQMEKSAIQRELIQTIEEKSELEKTASRYKNEMLEKQADLEEFRLRTIAQKRSKVAVDLADSLLETGLIKQAELSGMVDRLMVCEEDLLKSYDSLVKQAKSSDDSVESILNFMDYKGNDKLAHSTGELAARDLNRRGQSMGEAARELNNKR